MGCCLLGKNEITYILNVIDKKQVKRSFLMASFFDIHHFYPLPQIFEWEWKYC